MSIIHPRSITTKNGHEITLRSATIEDAEQLLEITTEVLAENDFNITTVDEFRFSVEQEEEWLEDVRYAPGQVTIVAEYAHDLLGLLNFHKNPRRRMQHQGILSINISRAWRDQGLGRALLQALIDWVREQPDLEKITLEVFATNQRAIALYLSLGFQEEGRYLKHIKMAPDVYVDVIPMALWVNAT